MSPQQKQSWVTLGSQSSPIPKNGLEQSLYFHIQHSLSETMPSYAIISEANPRKECFRGSVGAKLALQCTKDYLSIVTEEINSPEILELLPPDFTNHVLLEIANQWKQAISKHLKNHPLNSLEKEYSQQDASAIYDCSLLLFSKTVSSTCIINVGTGNVLLIDEYNQFISLPNNTTQSLYLANPNLSKTSVTIRLQESQHQSIEFIMLSTSGYTHSFKTKKGLKKAAYDFSRIMDIQGPDFVKEHLPSWLSETVSQGSGQLSTVIISKKVRRWYDGLSHAISREFQRIDSELMIQNKQLTKLEQHYQNNITSLQNLSKQPIVNNYNYNNSHGHLVLDSTSLERTNKQSAENEGSFLLEIDKLKSNLDEIESKQKTSTITIVIMGCLLIVLIIILGVRLL